MTKLSRWQRMRIPLVLYIVCTGVYLSVAGARLKKHSNDNHYVYLAQNLLDGRLSLKGNPPHQNDWALVETIKLRSGREVRGTYLKAAGPHQFKTTTGEKIYIPPKDIASRKRTYFVSFPWFPALLMLPFVAIWGLKFNDVLFTCLVAGLNPVLVYLVLRKLAALGHSARRVLDDLWLVGMFAFGTVHFFSSVMGQVWYTAQVVGVTLTALYVLAALNGRHPLLAGLCLALGAVTRTPIPFSVPLLLGEVIRRHLAPVEGEPAVGGDLWQRTKAAWPRIRWAPVIKDMAWSSIPVIGIAATTMTVNKMRFDKPFEFGHSYLNVRWAARIQKWGLFNYHFISRNLAAMFTLLPRLMAKTPYIKISWHGLSIFFTTPLLTYLIWPKGKANPLRSWLYLACLGPMILHLLYQNSGWVQFGYRFSLDYMVYLVALIAIGDYRLGFKARVLILFGVVVNTFGAITFNRAMHYYWDGMFPTQ